MATEVVFFLGPIVSMGPQVRDAPHHNLSLIEDAIPFQCPNTLTKKHSTPHNKYRIDETGYPQGTKRREKHWIDRCGDRLATGVKRSFTDVRSHRDDGTEGKMEVPGNESCSAGRFSD